MSPWPLAALLRLRRAERAGALRRLVEAQGRVAAGQEALAAARARAGAEALRVERLAGRAGPPAEPGVPAEEARTGAAARAPGGGPAARAAGEVACAVGRARASGAAVVARAGDLRRDRAALALAVEALARADAVQRHLEAHEAAWRRARWRRLERALEAEADDRGRPDQGLEGREGVPEGIPSRSLRPPSP